MTNKIIEKIAGEWLLVASLIGLGVTSFWRGRFPAYTATDFHVVYILFVFLVIIKGLEESCFLKRIAVSVQAGRGVPVKLILLTAILALFVTNDVALLTIVPLTLALEIERKHILIILETLSANAVSALTPFGNPQNIFIFYHYHVHPAVFVRVIFPFCFVSLGFILLMALKERGGLKKRREMPRIPVDRKGPVYVVFFFIFIVAVLKFIPLWLGGLALIYALSTRTFLYAAFGSQVISNVPSALLFADFTRYWHALLWGVSVGGFGNLIGSLASLIAYRLYKAKVQNTKPFLLFFHLYGYALFTVGILTYFSLN